MEAVNPNSKQAKTAITFLYLMISFAAIMSLYYYLTYQIVNATDLDAVDGLYIYMAWGDQFKFIYYAVYVIGIILFIRWFYRSYVDLKIKKGKVKFDEAWAVLGWFVPVYCFYKPYQIMKELHSNTNERLIFRWWGFWMITYALEILTFFIGTFSYSPESINIIICMNIVRSLLMIPAGLSAIKLIKQYRVTEIESTSNAVEQTTKLVNQMSASVATDDSAPAPSGTTK